MAIYKQDIVNINLESGSIFRSFLNKSIGHKDDDADRFGVRVFRDGEAVDLSGLSCQAVFMAPNGVNIALTSYGTVSGNEAYVTLPPACYDYEGQFCLAIKLVGGGVTSTVRIVDGVVERTGTSGAVAPTNAVPTYQEILATYDAMVAATSAANLAIAEEFDATKAYPSGKFLINDGNLYRLTADHAAGTTWANTSKVSTNFGDELSSLKSALSTVDERDVLFHPEKRNNGTAKTVVFTWNADKTECTATGTNTSTTEYAGNYIYGGTNVIPEGITPGETYHVKAKTTDSNMFLFVYLYVNGSYNTAIRVLEDTNITIPSNVSGVYFGIGVDKSATVSNAKVSNIGVYKKISVDINEFGELEDNYKSAIDNFLIRDDITILEFLQKGIDASGNYYSSQNRCATSMMALDPGTYEVTAQDGYQLMIYKGSLAGGARNKIIFNVETSESVAIVVKRADNGNISIAEARSVVYMEKFKPKELNFEDLDGISVKPLSMEKLVQLNVYSSNLITYDKCTEIYTMPISGLNVQRINIGSNDTNYMSVLFFRLNNGKIEPATDYDYDKTLWNGSVPSNLYYTRTSIYYPYEDNLYFSVIINYSDLTKLSDTFMSWGSVKNGNGRLTNISPASCTVGTMPAPNDDKTGLYPSFTLWRGAGYSTQQMFYGSVIRLTDAKAICCSAKLSLLCWWYNNEGVLLGSEHGSALDDYGFTGKNYIDLSKYGTDGYAVVLFRSPFTAKKPVSGQTTIILDEETMGGNHLREYVLNNVYVQYYNKTVISHTNGMHPNLLHNLELFNKLNCGDTYQFQYGGPVTATRLRMNAMKNSAPCFYGGYAACNSLFQNISLKSYITALKNFNSQVYISDWVPQGTIKTNFGMVCENIPTALCGIPWDVPASTFYADEIDYEQHGLTVTKDFDVINHFDEIKPGDWLIGMRIDDRTTPEYHHLLITDIIYINGACHAIEAIEAYPPMVRYRYLYLDKEFDRFNNEFARSEPIEGFYSLLVHPDRSLLNTLEDTFGEMSTDYTVGTLMCDRGTDSVYCATNGHCYITIADDEIESISIYKNGSLVETMTLPAVENRISFGDHPLKAVNIISVLAENGAGYYTLKADNSDDVQESFYVAPPQTISMQYLDDSVNVTISNPDDVVYMRVSYRPMEGVTPGRENFYLIPTFFPSEIVEGVINVPRYLTFEGDRYEVQNFYGIYKTDYGTYQVIRNETNHLTIINSDGQWNNPIYDS